MTLEQYILHNYKMQTGIDLSADEQAMYRIKETVKKVLIELETLDETEINLPFITADKDGPKHMQMVVSRDWNKTDLIDTDTLIFQKHRIHKPETKNQGLIYIIFALLIAVISALIIFLLA